HARQEDVWRNVIAQRNAGNHALVGLMVESYLHEGNQPFPKNPSELSYGVSITDACVSWEVTERMLLWAGEQCMAAKPNSLAAVYPQIEPPPAFGLRKPPGAFRAIVNGFHSPTIAPTSITPLSKNRALRNAPNSSLTGFDSPSPLLRGEGRGEGSVLGMPRGKSVPPYQVVSLAQSGYKRPTRMTADASEATE